MKITFQSPKYPGIQLGGGLPYFAVGTPYEVAPDVRDKIVQRMATLDPYVAKHFSYSVVGDESPATAIAVVAPAPPPAPTPEPEPEPAEDLAAPLDLTDDDRELVEFEVNKLLGKTIAEAEPVLIATGGNIELHRDLRRAYLDAVMAHADIQKGLKEVAERMIEQL